MSSTAKERCVLSFCIQITHLRAFNVTFNEVLLVWRDDLVRTRCIKTYEIQLQRASGNGIAAQTFRRVNANDVIFLSYQYVVSRNDREGELRVTLQFPFDREESLKKWWAYITKTIENVKNTVFTLLYEKT